MAWLLAEVIEPDDPALFRRTAENGRGRSVVRSGGRPPTFAGGRKNDDEGAADGDKYDPVASTETYAKATTGKASAKNMGTRKRAARFLHQLLITVRAVVT